MNNKTRDNLILGLVLAILFNLAQFGDRVLLKREIARLQALVTVK